MAELWGALTDPLAEPFLLRAVLEVTLVGVVGGVLGAWIVLYGVSYSAESLAHGMFPGLVVAAAAGIPLMVGGAAGAAIAATVIALLAGRSGLDRDATIGVVITAVFAVGVVFALRPGAPPGLRGLLFGDVLAVSARDLVVTAALAAVVLAGTALLHGRLLLVGFDRAAARALGVRPRPVEGLLLLAVAAAVVLSVEALGTLLVVAVLVAPGATARLVVRRVGPLMLLGSVVAIGGGVGGLYLSWYAGTAAGASVALVLVVLYLLTLAGGGMRRAVLVTDGVSTWPGGPGRRRRRRTGTVDPT